MCSFLPCLWRCYSHCSLCLLCLLVLPWPNDELDVFLSVLVGFSSRLFVFVPLRVSSGSLMFDLGSRAWSWFSPWLVPRNLWRPPYLGIGFMVFFVFGRKDISVISVCGFLTMRGQGRALDGYACSLVLRTTCCVHDNAENGFFVLVVFTTKWRNKCLPFLWIYGVHDILVETCSSNFKKLWVSKFTLLPRVINLKTCRDY